MRAPTPRPPVTFRIDTSSDTDDAEDEEMEDATNVAADTAGEATENEENDGEDEFEAVDDDAQEETQAQGTRLEPPPQPSLSQRWGERVTATTPSGPGSHQREPQSSTDRPTTRQPAARPEPKPKAKAKSQRAKAKPEPQPVRPPNQCEHPRTAWAWYSNATTSWARCELCHGRMGTWNITRIRIRWDRLLLGTMANLMGAVVRAYRRQRLTREQRRAFTLLEWTTEMVRTWDR